MQQFSNKQLKKFYKQNRFQHTKDIVIILENIQYARNIASFFRTADALNVTKVYLTGISTKPPFGKDLSKASRNKHKTVKWEYHKQTPKVIQKLKPQGYKIFALELTDKSLLYTQVSYPKKVAIIAGNETYGITKATLKCCDEAIFIPMYGKGKSLNVHVALAVLGYWIIHS